MSTKASAGPVAFGEALADILMLELHVSREDLASQLGYTRAIVDKWINNERVPDEFQFQKIVEAINVLANQHGQRFGMYSGLEVVNITARLRRNHKLSSVSELLTNDRKAKYSPQSQKQILRFLWEHDDEFPASIPYITLVAIITRRFQTSRSSAISGFIKSLNRWRGNKDTNKRSFSIENDTYNMNAGPDLRTDPDTFVYDGTDDAYGANHDNIASAAGGTGIRSETHRTTDSGSGGIGNDAVIGNPGDEAVITEHLRFCHILPPLK